MKASVSLMKALQALDVSLRVDGKQARAIVSKEALEALTGCSLTHGNAMLEAFASYRTVIEPLIARRFGGSDGKAVVFWGPADVGGDSAQRAA